MRFGPDDNVRINPYIPYQEILPVWEAVKVIMALCGIQLSHRGIPTVRVASLPSGTLGLYRRQYNRVELAEMYSLETLAHELCHSLQLRETDYAVEYEYRPNEIEANFVSFCYVTGFKPIFGDHERWGSKYSKPSRSLKLRLNLFQRGLWTQYK